MTQGLVSGPMGLVQDAELDSGSRARFRTGGLHWDQGLDSEHRRLVWCLTPEAWFGARWNVLSQSEVESNC